MSSTDKQGEGDQPEYPPPPPGPPPPATTGSSHQDTTAAHPSHDHQDAGSANAQFLPPPPPIPSAEHAPVASGGLLPEAPVELQASEPAPPPPPPPSQQPETKPIEDHYAPEKPTAQPSAVNMSFPPPPTSEIVDDVPPPPVGAQSHNEKTSHTVPHPTAADGAAAAVGSSTTAAATGAQPHKKTWGERFSQLGQRAAAKLGSPGFLPQSLDKECDKTAQILKDFCKEGVYADPSAPAADPAPGATKQQPKNRTLVTIPASVISRAVGLAIFTTLRGGMHVTGAMGSGVVVARLPDGSWGPPSAIQVLSVGGGFQFGIDICDCVCVINTREALSAFMNTRVSIGGDMAVSAGPYGAGGAVNVGSTMNSKDEEERRRKQKDKEAAASASAPATETTHLKPERPDAMKKRQSSSSDRSPVFSYVKSRGFYAGVQVDGTIIMERKEANAAFYGAPVRVEQILGGEVPSTGGSWPAGARVLHDALRGAEASSAPKSVSPATAPSAPAAASSASAGVGAGEHAGPATAADRVVPVPAASSKAAEAAAEAEAAARTRAEEAQPPAYTGAGPVDEPPPAYVDDGAYRPEVGDRKQG